MQEQLTFPAGTLNDSMCISPPGNLRDISGKYWNNLSGKSPQNFERILVNGSCPSFASNILIKLGVGFDVDHKRFDPFPESTLLHNAWQQLQN